MSPGFNLHVSSVGDLVSRRDRSTPTTVSIRVRIWAECPADLGICSLDRISKAGFCSCSGPRNFQIIAHGPAWGQAAPGRTEKSMPVTIKTPEQIEKMRVAGKLAAEVLEMIVPHV